jgi:hypothetical protein
VETEELEREVAEGAERAEETGEVWVGYEAGGFGGDGHIVDEWFYDSRRGINRGMDWELRLFVEMRQERVTLSY